MNKDNGVMVVVVLNQNVKIQKWLTLHVMFCLQYMCIPHDGLDKCISHPIPLLQSHVCGGNYQCEVLH